MPATTRSAARLLARRLRAPGSDWRASADPVAGAVAAFAERTASDPVTFVQIGSNDGLTTDPLHAAARAHGWTGVLVEAVPDVFARLCTNRGGDPRVALENVAVGDRDGAADFHHLRPAGPGEQLPPWYDQIGSFSLPTLLSHEGEIPDLRERLVTTRVPTLTFDSLCARHGLDRVDLLHIDAEGFDWQILRTVDLSRYRPQLVLFEFCHLDEADRAAARAHVTAHGYVLLQATHDAVCIPADRLGDPSWRRTWKRLGGQV